VTVVIDVEAVFFPRPGFGNDVQQRQMAARPIRELDSVHGVSPDHANSSVAEIESWPPSGAGERHRASIAEAGKYCINPFGGP
jgi:hypothetical protein